MKKHINIKPIFGRVRLLTVLAFLLIMSNFAFGQTISCSGTTSILPNGTFTVNGVTINTTSTGDVSTMWGGQELTVCSGHVASGGSLVVGINSPFSITLNFNKPLNNVVILLGGTGYLSNENFIFNSNGGTVSIVGNNPASCTSTIVGNQIISGLGASPNMGGGGIFKISAPANFTSLTINGNGGSLGSIIGLCTSSIVAAPNAVLSKSLSSATISDGGIATYTFNITNTANGAINLSNLSFTDNLPSGLRIAATPNVVVTGLTGSGSVTATSGGTSVAVSGYTIAGGGQATITVNVTNAPGQLNPTCTGNIAAFTNSATNISNLSLNLTNNITPVCLVVTAACGAGNVAPVFNNYVAADYYYLKTSSSYGIMCGGSTADLTVLVPSPAGPAGTTLTWHTASPATDSNKLTPAQAAAFTGATKKVYAAFWNGVCYSPTKLITVYAPICATDDDFTATPIIFGEGGTLPSLFANDTYKGITLSTLPPGSVHWLGELWTHTIAEVDLVNAATYGALKIDASHPIGSHEYMYSINDNSPDATPLLSKSTAYVKFKVICKAGETAPSVNPSLSNLCPATTVNLDSAHTGTKPAGTDLVWFTSNTTTGTQLTAAQVANAEAGTYYAFYYSTLGNCYSPVSNKVTVNITNCVTCSSGNSFVNLNSLYTGTHPDAPNTVIEWWSTATREIGTRVPDPTKVSQSGTYYAFFYDQINKCWNTDNSTAAVVVNILPPCYCTRPGDFSVAGTPTKVGISVQQKQAGWPESIPNGQVVLESREKGFVITRVAHVSFMPQATDAVVSPFAGMLVYDIQDSCVKLFNGINWNCIKRSCNDIGN